MSLFNILSKGFRSKNLQSNKILSQEEYKNKFYYGEEDIKREYYDGYITQRLAEEFGMKYNEKTKHWCSEWSDNQRFVVELYRPKGTHIFLRWGYNYDFIPDMNSKNKLTWHRTDSSIKIHLDDAWYNHIEYNSDQEWGFSAREFYNPVQCPVFQYEIPIYTSDMEFALKYIKSVIDKNISLIREWLDKVKTFDDAIEIINLKLINVSFLYVPHLCYVRAFLYAKNKDIDNSILSINQCYKESEIPQVILDKLYQLATE